VACGNPPTTLPIQMKNQEDIIKGLLSFIDLWKSLAQKDDMRLYASSHEGLQGCSKDASSTPAIFFGSWIHVFKAQIMVHCHLTGL
jgi:hypothetical protein